MSGKKMALLNLSFISPHYCDDVNRAIRNAQKEQKESFNLQDWIGIHSYGQSASIIAVNAGLAQWKWHKPKEGGAS